MDSVITISPTMATKLSNLDRFTLIRLCFTGALLCAEEVAGGVLEAGAEAAAATVLAGALAVFSAGASCGLAAAGVSSAGFVAAFSITS